MATQIGLTVADFGHMTISMIFDQIITYNNQAPNCEEPDERAAGIEDMMAF